MEEVGPLLVIYKGSFNKQIKPSFSVVIEFEICHYEGCLQVV